MPINDVRNTVLAIANKNNYGYISPQDFNLYCKQAQLDIYEDYFYQYNSWINRENNRTSGTGYADIVKGLVEVIDSFSITSYLAQPNVGLSNLYNLPVDYYLINKIFYYPTLKASGTTTAAAANTLTDVNANFTTTVQVGNVITNTSDNTFAYITAITNNNVLVVSNNVFAIAENYSIYDNNNITEVERVNQNKIFLLTSSNLTAPTTQFPAYVLDLNTITVYPNTIIQGGAIQTQYVRYPLTPQWTFISLQSGEPLFDPTSTSFQDFELPLSDEPLLIAKICQYVGIEIREADVYKFGQQEEINETQESS
tara:strand:- start:28864 stop:29796 length:933 start_codon:yes stop_codon:yes gene_type:complete